MGLILEARSPPSPVLFFGQSLFCSWMLYTPIILSLLYLLVFHHPERARGWRGVFPLLFRVFRLVHTKPDSFGLNRGNVMKRSGDDNSKS